MKKRTGRLIDEALVIEAQAGSASALDALIRRWQRRMYAYARRLLGREDEAWDACQEAWIGIVRGLRKLDDPGAFPARAYRIVTNKCKDRLHREMRQRELHERLAKEDGSDREIDSGSTELRDAFARLSGEMQAVLTLRYFEGFALVEIGEILGVAEGTVKSRLHRARTELKRILEKEHERL